MPASSQIQPFEYDLPAEKIAQHPPAVRGASRLLVLDRSDGSLDDRAYPDLIDYLLPHDLIIINTTKVIPARLLATNRSGATRELFLTERHRTPLLSLTARVVYRGKLRIGDILQVGTESIEVITIFEGGQAMIRATVPPVILAERFGQAPLPPYIKRNLEATDKDRYQTEFARQLGSVAAPTASLNLTSQALKAIRQKGIGVSNLTLHVGRGTFLPIRTDSLVEHIMHEEYYVIPRSTIKAIQTAKQQGGRVIAIGTTVTRALEHAAARIIGDATEPRPIRDEADIFIYPSYEFRIVDGLLTNFHAPDSTVLQLAAAFAGVEMLERAYRHALENEYAFLSYGDSMLIL